MSSIDELNASTYIQSDIDRLVENILRQMDALGDQSVLNDITDVSALTEKRSSARVPIDLLLGLRLIQVNGKDLPLPRPVEMKCKDISMGGVQLSSCVRIPGDDVRFALVAPLRDEILYCWVKVTWAKQDHDYFRYGCRFVEMPEPEELKLRFFVADEQQRLEKLRQIEASQLELYHDVLICDERLQSAFTEYVIMHRSLPESTIRAESLPDLLRRRSSSVIGAGPIGAVHSHVVEKESKRWYKSR